MSPLKTSRVSSIVLKATPQSAFGLFKISAQMKTSLDLKVAQLRKSYLMPLITTANVNRLSTDQESAQLNRLQNCQVNKDRVGDVELDGCGKGAEVCTEPKLCPRPQ